MVKSAVLFSALSAVLVTVTSSALENRQGATSIISASEVAKYKPYTYFAAIASCEPEQTRPWKCEKCKARSNFNLTESGGNGKDVLYWFVGYDRSLSEVIVGYQGNSAYDILDPFWDRSYGAAPLNTDLFPNLNSDIRTQREFGEFHAKSADVILKAVNKALTRSGYKNVTVVGHSLGGAVALISTVHLKLSLKNEFIRSVTYGMPRVGNQAFADHVDTIGDHIRIVNKNDITPVLPPYGDYVHTNTELHITDDMNWVKCEGQDNWKKECSRGYVPNIFFYGDKDQNEGPYDGVYMGCTRMS
ncbi:hypothetical protein AMATHDRAFT_63172 [Amanita thiersii Skay4041]|uniref:Fungal lipase-type domain-containing protein n=1 Tax=Amanita thiersii Skay4041 TaxID=703135 RepID=A0A2A9NP67_9AGAR|nr:hypothetical protein AMATHDRAFT_63172 [Amanita thiersii Skay4041]